MKQLTLNEYNTLPADVRTALRRKAFGHPRPLPPQLESQFDLEHLATLLRTANDGTAWMPEKWTNQADEDEVVERL